MKDKYLNRIKNNWKAGVTVALVSVPLSVSLAVASGGTPIQGIITEIWA
jgi:MFS superfamily sulfate permease-like transporter